MTSVIQQIDRAEQNMDRDLALLSLSPDQISHRIGLEFSRDEDDLGALSYLLFRIGDNAFLLERHDESSTAGTVLRGADTDIPGGIARRFRKVITALGIDSAEITWRTPLASVSPYSGRQLTRATPIDRRLRTG